MLFSLGKGGSPSPKKIKIKTNKKKRKRKRENKLKCRKVRLKGKLYKSICIFALTNFNNQMQENY